MKAAASYSSENNKVKLNYERGKHDICLYVRTLHPYPAAGVHELTLQQLENREMVSLLESWVGTARKFLAPERTEARHKQAIEMFERKNVSAFYCYSEGVDDSIIPRALGRIVGIWDYYESASQLILQAQNPEFSVSSKKLSILKTFLDVAMDEGVCILRPTIQQPKPHLHDLEAMCKIGVCMVGAGDPVYNFTRRQPGF